MAPKARFDRFLPILPALGLLLQVGACAGTARGRAGAHAAPAKVAHVDLEPMRIEVTRDSKGRAEVSMFDARDLFDEAGTALQADRYDQAIELYDRMVTAFPESSLVPPALFNAGLAHEGKRDLDAAIARYLDVVRRAGGTRHGLDAHIRAAAVMGELARWSDALHILDEVARRDLGEADRIEVHARRGAMLVESRRYPEAERALGAAIALAGPAPRDRRLASDSFVAMAHYYLGEVSRRQAEAVELRLPERELERAIEAKAKLVLAAQRRFEDTIRLADLHWATAAGYQLASMQQEMWRALLGAPVPPGLTSQESAIYRAEVRVLARAHLEKALAAHEMNVKVAEHHAARTRWSEGSRLRIAEIRRVLADTTSGASQLRPTQPPAK